MPTAVSEKIVEHFTSEPIPISRSTSFAASESRDKIGMDIRERIYSNQTARPFDLDLSLTPDSPSQVGWIFVNPSSKPSIVKVTSKYTATPSQSFSSRSSPPSSSEFFAAIRRRVATSLTELVRKLREHHDSDTFVFVTHAIVTQIQKELQQLSDAEREANSREILRQVRDSILNGGWNRLRVETAQAVILKALKILQKDGEVTGAEADSVFDLLLDGGLTPVVLPVLHADDAT